MQQINDSNPQGLVLASPGFSSASLCTHSVFVLSCAFLPNPAHPLTSPSDATELSVSPGCMIGCVTFMFFVFFFPLTRPLAHRLYRCHRCRFVSSVPPCRQPVTSLGLKIESGWKFFVPSPTVSTGWRGKKKIPALPEVVVGS